MIILSGDLFIGPDYLQAEGLRIVVDGDEESRVIYEAIKASIQKMDLNRHTLRIHMTEDAADAR